MNLADEDFTTMYYLRDDWQTLTVDVQSIESGLDEEYNRKYYDFKIINCDSKLRINSRPFMQILKQELIKIDNYHDTRWYTVTFKKSGKGQSCTYHIEDMCKFDEKQKEL